MGTGRAALGLMAGRGPVTTLKGVAAFKGALLP